MTADDEVVRAADPDEPHTAASAGKLNWLRAGVLGANDGIVSVSSQRDSETALLAQERQELAETPGPEFNELTALYQAKGLSEQTARQVATELTAHDALAAHLDAELHIDPDDLANPTQAAAASAASFTCGALLPLVVSATSSAPPSASRRQLR